MSLLIKRFYKIRISYALLLLTLLMLPLKGQAIDQCGGLDNAYGPYDYLDPATRAGKLPIVEEHHFHRAIENLAGNTSVVLDNLDYTLRAFPNHHRALHAVSRLQRRLGGSLPQKSDFTWHRSAECYFKRATRFQPKDPTVYMLYGIHLHLTGKLDEALKKYKRSERIEPDSADLHYNLGLLYFDREEYALAKQHARKAYRLGHQLPGLRKKLASAGQWP